MKKLIVLFIAGLFVVGGLGYAACRVAKQDDDASTEFRIAYMDSSYERPPDKSDFVVSSDEDRSFLDGVLKTIFDGKDNLSDEEKSIGILKYVCSSMREETNRGSATKMIRDGYALCGGKSQVFVTLCRRAGLPARYVGSMYMKMMGSHAISEVFYDGNWHFYDATLGVFFYSNPDYDKQGRVVSFHEVVADPYGWAAFKVAPKAGAGVYDAPVKDFALTRVVGGAGNEGDVELLELYRRDIKEGFPVAYGSNDIVSYPVDADVSQESAVWFGEVNDSDRELAGYEQRFSGSHYLGTSIPPAFHTWLIKAPAFTTVTVEYYSAHGRPPKLSVVPLRAAKVIRMSYEDKKVRFTLYVTDVQSVVSVYCPEGTFSVDAMSISR